VEGGIYFFTLVTYNRQPLLVKPSARKILHNSLESVKKKHPFVMNAICLLPDHLHCIWTLPENDSDYSLRWKEIKRQFSHNYLPIAGIIAPPNESRQNRQESPIWQRRFWEHTIRDEADLEAHLNYIHFNPVKHGLVMKPGDWEWSSFLRYVDEGKYDQDWGNQVEMSRLSTIPVEFE
jgi:putative transposase